MMPEWIARWNATLPGKEWRRRGRNPIPVGSEDGTNPNPTPTYPTLFAGHVPNRVLLGMAASNFQRPSRDEAVTIINRPQYEFRLFDTSITLANLNGMLTEADSFGAYPVVSFKHPVGDIAAGNADTLLNIIRDRAIARRTEGPTGTPMPFAVGNHHEPYGDGISYTAWTNDQIYASNYLSGWTTNPDGTKGTYTAANDVSDICAWVAILNGHVFGPKNVKPDGIAMYSQQLIDTFRINRSILAVDTYDPNPPNNDPFAPGGYSATADRTSRKIQAFIDFARARNCGALGLGEWSCTTLEEMNEVWRVLRENRDIMGFANYFNSFANSRWDWRLIPDGYPAYNGTNSKGLTDIGGHAYTQAKLDLYRTIVDESTSPTYTTPL